MSSPFLTVAFLNLYGSASEVHEALEKSAKKTQPAKKSDALDIIPTPRGKNGRPDYSQVPEGKATWVEINKRDHPLHGKHVLVQKGKFGFTLVHGDSIDSARGDDATVASRKAALLDHEDEVRRAERKKREQKVKEDERGGIFGALAGIRRRASSVINSAWPDDDDEPEDTTTPPTAHQKAQDARNVTKSVSVSDAHHDVSEEARDESGKWTKGGGTAIKHRPMNEVHKPVIGDTYVTNGKRTDYTITGFSPDDLSVKMVSPEGKELSVAWPDKWEMWQKVGLLTFKSSGVAENQAEPWQQTRAEFVKNNPGESWRHENGVLNALTSGKPVPKKVTDDYPGILQRAKHFDFDWKVAKEPKEGMMARVVSTESPDYGKVFKVTNTVDSSKADSMVAFTELDNKGNPVGLPLEMELWKWKQQFPYSYSGQAGYANAEPAPLIQEYSFAAHIDGDIDLPPVDGSEIKYFGPKANDLVSAKASAQKAVTVQGLADELVDNPDFVQFCVNSSKKLMNASRKWNPDITPPYGIKDLDNLSDTEKSTLVYKYTNDLVASWAQTSSDSSDMSLGVQRAAKDMFGLSDDSVYTPWLPSPTVNKYFTAGDANTADENYKNNGAGYRAFLQAQYKKTQLYLHERKIQHLSLYRGYAEHDNENSPTLANSGLPMALKLQPLSSFSSSEGIARTFARGMSDDTGKLIRVDVPAEDIVSLPYTGQGALVEKEAIVAGKPLVGTMYTVPSGEDKWIHGQDHEDPQAAAVFKSIGPVRFISVDEDLMNADWTKQYWDFAEPNTEEYTQLLALQGKTPEEAKELPVYYWRTRQQGIQKSHDVHGQLRDGHGRWTKVGGGKLLPEVSDAQRVTIHSVDPNVHQDKHGNIIQEGDKVRDQYGNEGKIVRIGGPFVQLETKGFGRHVDKKENVVKLDSDGGALGTQEQGDKVAPKVTADGFSLGATVEVKQPFLNAMGGEVSIGRQGKIIVVPGENGDQDWVRVQWNDGDVYWVEKSKLAVILTASDKNGQEVAVKNKPNVFTVGDKVEAAGVGMGVQLGAQGEVLDVEGEGRYYVRFGNVQLMAAGYNLKKVGDEPEQPAATDSYKVGDRVMLVAPTGHNVAGEKGTINAVYSDAYGVDFGNNLKLVPKFKLVPDRDAGLAATPPEAKDQQEIQNGDKVRINARTNGHDAGTIVRVDNQDKNYVYIKFNGSSVPYPVTRDKVEKITGYVPTEQSNYKDGQRVRINASTYGHAADTRARVDGGQDSRFVNVRFDNGDYGQISREKIAHTASGGTPEKQHYNEGDKVVLNQYTNGHDTGEEAKVLESNGPYYHVRFSNGDTWNVTAEKLDPVSPSQVAKMAEREAASREREAARRERQRMADKDKYHTTEVSVLANEKAAKNEKALLEGEFEPDSFEKLDPRNHVNSAYKAYMDFNGTRLKVLVKPDSEACQELFRDGIKPGQDCERERASYVVNNALQHLIDTPEVVVRDTPKGRATVQRFMIDTDGTFVDTGADIYDSYFRNDISDIALFDAITGNLDRHHGNIMVREKYGEYSGSGLPTVVGIDHGLAFPEEGRNWKEYSNQIALDQAGGDSLTEKQASALESMRSNRDKIDAELSPLIPASALSDMWERVDYIYNAYEIPTAGQMGEAIWQ